MWQTGRNGKTSGTLAVLAGESVQSLKRLQFATGSRDNVGVEIILDISRYMYIYIYTHRASKTFWIKLICDRSDDCH